MSTRCDECNAEIVIPAIGTIKGAVFSFCSPQCRAEFAGFCQRIGLAMVIPAASCDELDTAHVGQPILLVAQNAPETDLETADPLRPAYRVVASHYSTCEGNKT